MKLLLLLLGTLIFQSAQALEEANFKLAQPELFAARGSMTNAWADFDGDGDLDLFVGFGPDRPNRLYRNSDGHFTDVAAEVGVADMEGTRAVAWGDYNADGHLDLYVGFSGGSTTGPSKIPNKLYRNKGGGGRFTDVTGDLGMVLPLGKSRQVSWIDYDNDGDVDLFVGFRDMADVLYRNEGGAFTNVSRFIGLTDSGAAMGGVWFDFDLDGDLDLYLANMDGYPNRLYRNDGARFVDVAPKLDLASGGRAIASKPGDHSMAGSIRPDLTDFDNDGDLDIFLTNMNGTDGFYRNDGSGTFVNVAPGLGLAHPGYRGTATWADFDNDGYRDVYVNGTLYRNDGTRFSDSTPAVIRENVGGYGALWADYDGDGAMDLSLSSRNHYLIRNLLPPEKARQHLKVLVLDAEGRYTRAGTEIRLYQAGTTELLGTGIMDTGSGYNAQNAMPVHFGMAGRKSVDVEITSMTRGGRKASRLTNVSPGDLPKNCLVVRVGLDGQLVK
jgi:hypothetical protein